MKKTGTFLQFLSFLLYDTLFCFILLCSAFSALICPVLFYSDLSACPDVPRHFGLSAVTAPSLPEMTR